MNIFAKLITVFAVIVLTACEEPAEVKMATADKIITNARIWTGNEKQPWAETVVIDKGRIIAVGDETITAEFSANDVINAGGNMVLPGFIDNHVHFMDGSSSLASVQTIDATSEQQFANIIMDYAKEMPSGEWMLGGI